MAKRGREASTEEGSPSRDQYSSIDRISDEVLVCILSFLTFKEATATSILSSRWRYLWTFTSKLDFDGSHLLKVEKRESLLDEDRRKYIGWVNYITKSHKASTIEEFRVYFNLNKKHKTDIDQWLVYALARKVQRLELIMTASGGYVSRGYDECYSFPDELLRNSGSWSLDFNYLKHIIMYSVNVNGEALEFFLHNCPLLEHLSISGSGKLSSLRVNGSFPSLKRLEITWCRNLSAVEIRGAKLVYLKYWGRKIHFFLENVPLLSEIYLGGELTCSMEDILLLFSSFLPQLEILRIDRSEILYWVEAKEFYSAVKMWNLKQLIVKVFLDSNSLRALTNLIRASPRLQRFVVEPRNTLDETMKRKVKKIARTYTYLKEVEFLSYRGAKCELELIIHFLENAVGLEKIVIVPLKGTREEEIVIRTRARKQLMKKVTPRIKLEIR